MIDRIGQYAQRIRSHEPAQYPGLVILSSKPARAVKAQPVIGLFDSGLGGLTVIGARSRALPSADIVFFADQAHVPYGDRTHDDLLAASARRTSRVSTSTASTRS